ncbi:hypothetical protein U0070_000899 [Myodes glareolus]|uniref:DUF4629 domain-containing protein n=1 Tax=Myodes glareolus TaxID=447135 RepID=A0AAW0I0K1_MYOGA
MCSATLCTPAEECHTLSRKCWHLIQGLHISCWFSMAPPIRPQHYRQQLMGRSTDRRETPFLDFPLTIIDQNITHSSLSVTGQFGNISHPNALVQLYPTQSISIVQETPAHISNKGCILAPCYQEGTHVCSYNHNSLDPRWLEKSAVPAGLRLCVLLWESGLLSALRDGDATKGDSANEHLNTFLHSAIYCPTAAQSMPDTSLQGQTLCLLQSPDLGNACTQDAQMKTTSVRGDRSLIALMHSPSEFLALPSAPSLEKTQKNNADEMNAEQSTPLDSYEGTKYNQDASLLPLAHSSMQQPLSYSDAGSLRQKLASHNATVGNSSLGLEEPETLQSVMESSEKTKRTRESNSKTIQELKPSSYSVKEEEKTTISKTKKKRNPPELSNDIFNKT